MRPRAEVSVVRLTKERLQVTDTPDPDRPAEKPSKSPSSPKRGAFPTPKSEIEQAEQYSPDEARNDQPNGKRDPEDATHEEG